MSETLHFDTLVAAADPAVDLIFVHGLAGDPRETWTSSGGSGEVWPCWLAQEIPGANIHTLGYGSSFLAKWADKEMTLYELAESALEHMAGYGIGTRPLAFIGHSLGGLVVKQMLRSAGDATIARWKTIAGQTKLIAFIATPHLGASIAKVFKFIAPHLSSAHIDLIADDTGALRNLNNAYRDRAPALGIRTLAYYETHKTKSAAFIVDKNSADPGVAGTRALALAGDHVSVCKPANRDAQLYVSLRANFLDVFEFSNKPEAPTNSRLHDLPPDVAHFQGRGGEETALLTALRRGGGTQAITALRGIGGIGKSALAVRVARQLTSDYPAAQILVNLRGTDADPLTPRGAMEDVIRRFEPDAPLPDDNDGVGEIYRDILTRHKSLLILDNARDDAQVHSLLPPPPSAAIITSRRQLDSPAIISHRLDNLAHVDAVALLGDIFAERAPENKPDKDTLDGLALACADHPLALTVGGIYAANRADRIDLTRYAEQIVERRESLKLGGVARHDVMASLGLGLDRLAEEDAGLAERWRDLAVFPADFDGAAAAAVWGDEAGADAAHHILAGLADGGLLEAGSGRERFRLHDLMRDLARLDQPSDRFAAAEARHGAHFMAVLSAADNLYLKGGAQNILAGLALYDREQANIHTGQARAVAAMGKAPSLAAG